MSTAHQILALVRNWTSAVARLVRDALCSTHYCPSSSRKPAQETLSNEMPASSSSPSPLSSASLCSRSSSGKRVLAVSGKVRLCSWRAAVLRHSIEEERGGGEGSTSSGRENGEARVARCARGESNSLSSAIAADVIMVMECCVFGGAGWRGDRQNLKRRRRVTCV